MKQSPEGAPDAELNESREAEIDDLIDAFTEREGMDKEAASQHFATLIAYAEFQETRGDEDGENPMTDYMTETAEELDIPFEELCAYILHKHRQENEVEE
jgi:hypothetical protein